LSKSLNVTLRQECNVVDGLRERHESGERSGQGEGDAQG
jgi:hypothetical protein